MDFIKSNSIIVYDKENDEFYFTTLKIGQTYLKVLRIYYTHRNSLPTYIWKQDERVGKR